MGRIAREFDKALGAGEIQRAQEICRRVFEADLDLAECDACMPANCDERCGYLEDSDMETTETVYLVGRMEAFDDTPHIVELRQDPMHSLCGKRMWRAAAAWSSRDICPECAAERARREATGGGTSAG